MQKRSHEKEQRMKTFVFERWCDRLQLSTVMRDSLLRLRSSPPVRRVQGRLLNVCGTYASRKMGVSIQFESHTYVDLYTFWLKDQMHLPLYLGKTITTLLPEEGPLIHLETPVFLHLVETHAIRIKDTFQSSATALSVEVHRLLIEAGDQTLEVANERYRLMEAYQNKQQEAYSGTPVWKEGDRNHG